MRRLIVEDCVDCADWGPADSYGNGTVCGAMPGYPIVPEVEGATPIPEWCPRLANQAVEKFYSCETWISVKDSLPKKCSHVLLRAVLHGGSIEDIVVHYEGYLTGNNEWSDWCGDTDEGVEITHWMPLPAPPATK
jgi:hypothetical protein